MHIETTGPCFIEYIVLAMAYLFVQVDDVIVISFDSRLYLLDGPGSHVCPVITVLGDLLELLGTVSLEHWANMDVLLFLLYRTNRNVLKMISLLTCCWSLNWHMYMYQLLCCGSLF